MRRVLKKTAPAALAPWLKLTLLCPPAAAEAAGAFLFDEAGATGLWEDRPDERGRLVLRAAFKPEDRPRLANLAAGWREKLAAAGLADPGDFDFTLDLEEDMNWAEKWKEGLGPIAISPRLTLAPTWLEPPPAEIVLRLDPGLAFGSGRHATTRLCLELLAELAPAASRILDVGFGSGVLALAAAALNPRAEVIGVDNDPDVLPAAQANAAANGLSVNFSLRPVAELPPAFDLIAANITLGPLTELAPVLAALLSPDGRLILSGLLAEQAAEAAGAYLAFSLEPERRLDREEWTALLLRPKAAAK